MNVDEAKKLIVDAICDSCTVEHKGSASKCIECEYFEAIRMMYKAFVLYDGYEEIERRFNQ